MKKLVACAALTAALLVPASGAAAQPLPAGVEFCRPPMGGPVPGVVFWSDLDGDGDREQGSVGCFL